VVIWQGRGGITALIIVLSITLVMAIANVMGWHGPDWPTYFAMGGLAAAGNAVLVAITPSNKRTVIDKATGQEFEISAKHTLFWIPIKYWTFIILAYPVIGTLRDTIK
jgi:hypothetical protein